ncbi:MAG: cytochrome c3 family protein [Acidobacteriota bacterium]|nr:cytochrome c3 family protein [Acidobacteriota bacterium]
MPCNRCHTGVERGPVAGLPPVSLCVRCHKRFIPEHPEIVKLVEMYESGEPIRWRKINAMPPAAAVQFHHAAHIKAAVACETCHGDVSNMTLAVRVVNTADMGWCVDCHVENEASIDCLTCHH